MASPDDWDPQMMLDLYLHDYMVKKKMDKTAAIFKGEAKVPDCQVVIDSPEGFLYEWWSVLHDVWASMHPKNQGDKAEAYLNKTLQMKENEQRNKYLMESHSAMNQQIRPGKFQMDNNCRKMLGQPASSLLAANIYEDEHHRTESASKLDPSLHLLDVNKVNLSKSVATSSSNPLEHMFRMIQQQAMRDNRIGINLEKSVAIDPSLCGLQNAVFQMTGSHDSGMYKGVNPVPLNAWPLQKSTAELQQPLLAQLLTAPEKQKSVAGSSTNIHWSNPMPQQSECRGKDRQMMVPTKQMAEHQLQYDRPQKQKILKNGRKRKAASHLEAGENPFDCEKAKEDVPVLDNVESFLCHDDDIAKDTNTPFSILKRPSTACNKNEHQGFSFEEVASLHLSKAKVLCCHFSSEGKLLASAGHEKKVFVWSVETFDFVNTSEEHSLLITDVRFGPSSSIFATSSFDRTVKIWDAARPSKSLFQLVGHAERVLSIDFHPRKIDLLCSCDINDEIRFWNVNQSSCLRVSKGAIKQVRFQPQSGKLLATASGNVINLFDVETGNLHSSFKGHVKDIHSICWDPSGKYIASVSDESARVWSTISDGKCVHELQANGNKFQSCTFHPGYSQLLIVGGYQFLELWNPTETSKTLSISAHSGLVTALADSVQTEMVASASHDQCVKLWK
ncbi:transcriptional corepressor LEUNIG isoform X2 [Ziziphus jujuba]|uniref:Transcriptional corepressor LEUNIG isoform X2 n=1 Tax=Ziziphus jujuba TaxID=326968 RepID=A0ABM3IXE0_ZIZJJ|nr:transcriptional corepressor LEUNIG isoform X2 [Ziziphus jujuba]